MHIKEFETNKKVYEAYKQQDNVWYLPVVMGLIMITFFHFILGS